MQQCDHSSLSGNFISAPTANINLFVEHEENRMKLVFEGDVKPQFYLQHV